MYGNKMIRKFAVYIIFLSTLNGCVQGIALLGPAFSYSKSGSVVQSALSYGTNTAFRKMRERESTNNNKNAFDDYGTIDNDYSLLLVKDKTKNASSIISLTNQ
jgi:hypothetical protein|tara:strand:+ start:556 stop:864 length:309 start_codon:yes stop_codon:yes gene_type:complete